MKIRKNQGFQNVLKYRENPVNNAFTGQIFGGLEEIRTPDPHNANVVRSQLRYKPGFTYPDIIAVSTNKVKQNLNMERDFFAPG